MTVFCSLNLWLEPLKEGNTSCSSVSYMAKVGQNLSICCPVSSYPPPVVSWRKDGTQLQEGRGTVFTVILDKDDKFGNYTCTARDSKASIGPIVITVMNEICKYRLKNTY